MKYSGNFSILFLQEHLFDVSDLQDREPALISKCGTLEVVFNYSAIKAKMAVKIGVARDIPTKERGGASNVQVSQTNHSILYHPFYIYCIALGNYCYALHVVNWFRGSLKYWTSQQTVLMKKRFISAASFSVINSYCIAKNNKGKRR